MWLAGHEIPRDSTASSAQSAGLVSSRPPPWPLISSSEVSSRVVPGVQTVTDCYSSQWMDGGNPLDVSECSTAVVDNQLYLWGGDQNGMPHGAR